jgi:hypothetical protein
MEALPTSECWPAVFRLGAIHMLSRDRAIHQWSLLPLAS